MKEKLKAFFKAIAENWKIILGGVMGFLAILFGIFGYEKINEIFGKNKQDDESKEVIKNNDKEIDKTKKWIKDNKKLHETNEQAIDRYNQFLANNVPNS
jgi:hypothetical protein